MSGWEKAGSAVAAVSRAPEQAGDQLITDLRAGRGVAAITPALDAFRHRWALRRVVAVTGAGPDRQVFVSGGDSWPPTETYSAPPGVHTDPVVPESAAELATLAELCALAGEIERLSQETVHDPLTGLYNRRGFDDLLSQAVSRSIRYDWPFALVLFDVDSFKRINDTWGHPYGDTVLRQIGDSLRDCLRGGDVAARFGGDEFALLLADATADGAPPVIERLAAKAIEAPDGTPVGLSAGAAACPGEARSAEDLYQMADLRLYRTKAIRKGLDPDSPRP